MKYIMIDDKWPIFFGDYFTHSHVANLLGEKVTSAGFCNQVYVPESRAHAAEVRWETSGESISLNMKPADADAKIITRVLRS
jgi:hypothetical protein